MEQQKRSWRNLKSFLMRYRISTLSFIILVVFIGVAAYTIVDMIFYWNDKQVDMALTTALFTFATAELAICWRIWAKKHDMDDPNEGGPVL